MASRLWSDPPLKADRTLDYARLTPAEIVEDLSEGLADRIINGHQDALRPFFHRLKEVCPDVGAIRSDLVPTGALVDAMEALLRREVADPRWESPEAQELLIAAITEIAALLKR